MNASTRLRPQISLTMEPFRSYEQLESFHHKRFVESAAVLQMSSVWFLRHKTTAVRSASENTARVACYANLHQTGRKSLKINPPLVKLSNSIIIGYR